MPCEKRGSVRRAIIALFLLAACAYRPLKGRVPQGTGFITLQYERDNAIEDPPPVIDVRPSRIFASGSSILAAVDDPKPGFFVSTDSGASWSLTPMDAQIYEIQPAGKYLYARALRQLWRSADGGKSWGLALTGKAELESFFAAPGGRIFAAAAGRVYATNEDGHGLRALTVQGAEGARFRSVAAEGQTLLVSARGDSKLELYGRVRELLDGHTGETDAALDSTKPVSFNGGMVYVSHDGGALWQKSSLGLDAWLTVVDGAIYAVAADPLLEAAALARAHPGLARALSAQLHDQRVEADDVRLALAWPGREGLLKRPLGLVFRSTDGGDSWTRATDVPEAVQADVLRQWSWFPFGADELQRQQQQIEPRLPQRQPGRNEPQRQGQPSGPQRQGPPGEPQRQGQPSQPAPAAPQPAGPHVADEVLLSFLDPLRLLGRQNRAAVLGFAAAGEERWAYLPTQAQWEALSAAVISGTSNEGEIWTGRTAPVAGAQAEVLHSADSGATFSPTPGLPDGWPTSIAAAAGAAYLTLRGSGAVRIVP
jgi:photosystem II stability/assembly factor-like uncharacterized protein